MADSDLSDLLDEVNFSTPERSLLEEATDNRENSVLNSESERRQISSQTGTSRRVLISDGLLTRGSGTLETFSEKRIETLPVMTYGEKGEGESEFLPKSGTLPEIIFDDKKKYKLLCVESLERLCRAVMG